MPDVCCNSMGCIQLAMCSSKTSSQCRLHRRVYAIFFKNKYKKEILLLGTREGAGPRASKSIFSWIHKAVPSGKLGKITGTERFTCFIVLRVPARSGGVRWRPEGSCLARSTRGT